MFFKLRTKHIAQSIFPFMVLFFMFSALAQDDLTGADLDEGIISCENLPAILKQYHEDVEFDRTTAKAVLLGVSKFLRNVSKTSSVTQSDLREMIDKLGIAAHDLQRSEDILGERGYIIAESLEECLSSSEPSSEPSST